MAAVTAAVGDVIGERIARYRKAKGWSVPRLAKECEQAGMPQLSEDSLRNIERNPRTPTSTSRARRSVSVDELLLLARLLDVPPILIVLPFGEDHVAITPEVVMHTYDAFRWIVGDYKGRGSFPLEAMPIEVYEELSTALDEVRGAEYSVDTDPDSGRYATAIDRLVRALNLAATVGVSVPPIEARWVRDVMATGKLRAADRVPVLDDEVDASG